jgi:hypothetical protein
MLTANALDLVRRFEAMSERTQMPTPGWRRRRERLIRPERHAPLRAVFGDLVVFVELAILHVYEERLFRRAHGRQNQRPACLLGEGGRAADE